MFSFNLIFGLDGAAQALAGAEFRRYGMKWNALVCDYDRAGVQVGRMTGGGRQRNGAPGMQVVGVWRRCSLTTYYTTLHIYKNTQT